MDAQSLNACVILVSSRLMFLNSQTECMEWSVYRQRRRSDSVLRGDRMPILSASSSLFLRLIVVVSATVVALTHAYGAGAWVALPDATLTRFDLSTIQSEVGNPSGYLVSLVGMLVGVGLIGYVALRVRGIVPRPASLLLVAVVLFFLNAVATYFMPNVWRRMPFLRVSPLSC